MVDWREFAACLEADPELFFPVGTTGPAVPQIEKAVAVCRKCEVAETCLQFAMSIGARDGIWGGYTEDERRYLKRRRPHLSAPVPRAFTDAGPVSAKVQAGIGAGWSANEISAVVGVGADTISRLNRGLLQRVTLGTAEKILGADLSRRALVPDLRADGQFEESGA
jgi:WhiB family redox-sensing transcriptional regulator